MPGGTGRRRAGHEAGEHTREIKTLKKALSEGGAVLRACFGRVSYRLKGRANLLTEADLRSQRKIIAAIKRDFPGHGFIAEEAGGSRAPGPEATAGQQGGPVWVIDPLNGTTNYAHTFPTAAVSIAFMAGGRVLAGGVLDPFRKELFIAERGRGAFLNGRRIEVSSAPTLARSLLVTGFPYDRAKKAGFYCSFLEKFLVLSHDVRRMGSASLDLAWLAAGRTDGYWEFGLKPWDVAAGSLLVEEAGGKITDFSGKPWKEAGDYGAQLLATNRNIHAEMLSVITRILRSNGINKRRSRQPVRGRPEAEGSRLRRSGSLRPVSPR
jgi:myo-inositol-1(or 4)-monophosphatase